VKPADRTHEAQSKQPEPQRGCLVVISGPSGVGKTTICRRLVERLGAVLSISATTRPRGKDELDGRNYWFLTREQFEAKIQAGEFLEYAEYLGHLYGTPAKPVDDALRAGKIVVLEIEVQGGVQVARRFPDAVMIYVLPTDPAVLVDRIQGRGRDREEVIEQRLAHADGEIRFARDSGVYSYFVVNDVLDETVEQIVEIIERHRRSQGPSDRTTPPAGAPDAAPPVGGTTKP